MSDIGKLIAEQTRQVEDFKARKSAEREELSSLSDAAIERVTQDPDAYLHYLDAQADNPVYSASNVLLALEQRPELSIINSMRGWNAMGRSIISGKTGIKVFVSEPYFKDGKTLRGYKVARVFDYADTSGNRTLNKVTLRNDTTQMQMALHALLVKSPVKVNPVQDRRLDAYYDPERQVIDISVFLPDNKTFSALAREVFRAKVHDHGKFMAYTREDTELDAASASYMLCRSFGVPCEKPDTSRLSELYEGMEPQDARSILDGIQGAFRELNSAIQRDVAPQQEQRRSYNQPTR
ncbi:MAG: hypothetical protein K6G54_06920 [Oscillospiraceae bacterium]|nr:hypothetical protein [Oscillospiraceae bacterium]